MLLSQEGIAMAETIENSPSSAMWATPGHDEFLHDEDCSPTKTCRNMVGVSFDGLAEPGASPAESWRARLEREGKVAAGSGSVRDLVLEDPGS